MIEVEASGIEELSRAMAQAPVIIDMTMVGAMRESTHLVRDLVRPRTPVRTGRLAASWDTRTETEGSEVTGHVFTRVDYGGFVERGTRPHMIFPREKKALFWPGAAHPVGKVHHPGFAGRRMARTGAAEAVPGILEIFRSRLQRSLRATFRIHGGAVNTAGIIDIQ